jgi:hypothetical protein
MSSIYLQFAINFVFFGLPTGIYIYSAPNNSNETYTFCVWAERAVFGGAKTALKFKYEI